MSWEQYQKDKFRLEEFQAIESRRKVITGAVLFFTLSFIGTWGGFRNVGTTKHAAKTTWINSGLEIVGYEGYQWNLISGGDVWYILQRTNDTSVTYNGRLSKWGNEFHIYNLKAIDAIRPR